MFALFGLIRPKKITYYKVMRQVSNNLFVTFYAYNDIRYRRGNSYYSRKCTSFENTPYFCGCKSIADAHNYLSKYVKNGYVHPELLKGLCIVRCTGMCVRTKRNRDGINVVYCKTQSIEDKIIDVEI